jgi:hypothetical protein
VRGDAPGSRVLSGPLREDLGKVDRPCQTWLLSSVTSMGPTSRARNRV